MPGQNLITQRSRSKVPQSVVEGITAATYAVTPANPAFITHGRDARLVDGSDPTVQEERISGDTDDQGDTKTREKNTVTYMAKLHSSDKALVQWAVNKPNGAGTPDESRTFFDSYMDDAGMETFITYLGCKPQSYSISKDNEGFITLEIAMSCKRIIEDTDGPDIGTGSYGMPILTAPLTHLDGGVSPFIYNGNIIEENNFTINGSYNESVHDSNGSLYDLYRTPTQRLITGSTVIFKKDRTLQADAKDAVQRIASYTIDAGNIILSFTNFKFLPSGEELTGDTSDATMENKSWKASSVNIA